ncbi:hypothetical protein Tco_0607330, partial [Tanacetum coccineum]
MVWGWQWWRVMCDRGRDGGCGWDEDDGGYGMLWCW